MLNKLKEFAKSYLIGITLGLFVFGIVGVSATTYFLSNQTTYDHSVSGMTSTNAQNAVDELYNACK